MATGHLLKRHFAVMEPVHCAGCGTGKAPTSRVTVEGAPDRNASTVLDPHPISRPGSTGTTCTSTWSVPGPGSDIPATPSLIRQFNRYGTRSSAGPAAGWPQLNAHTDSMTQCARKSCHLSRTRPGRPMLFSMTAST